MMYFPVGFTKQICTFYSFSSIGFFFLQRFPNGHCGCSILISSHRAFNKRQHYECAFDRVRRLFLFNVQPALFALRLSPRESLDKLTVDHTFSIPTDQLEKKAQPLHSLPLRMVIKASIRTLIICSIAVSTTSYFVFCFSPPLQ